jgi:hypothetical protein
VLQAAEHGEGAVAERAALTAAGDRRYKRISVVGNPETRR